MKTCITIFVALFVLGLTAETGLAQRRQAKAKVTAKAKAKVTAKTKYYKLMTKAPKRMGVRLQPRFAKAWLRKDLRKTVDSRTEQLLERVRKEVAPTKPGRTNSIFATSNPNIWNKVLSEGRQLVSLEPVDKNQIVVVDARHYEKVYELIGKADAAKTAAEKTRLMRNAERAAVRYWTKPATNVRARPEILLGGGATVTGVVSQ